MTFKTKTGAAAFASILACSATAMAADLPSRVAPPTYIAPTLVSGWDGFYAGSTYGYGFTNFRTSQATSRSKTESGQLGGGVVGYNFQTGHFVYGAEASIDLNVIRGNVAGGPGLLPTHLDTLYDIRLRARLGYEFGWFMPFVAGGAVINEGYQRLQNPSFLGDTDRSVGWTAGAGVDVKLNPRSFLPFLPESFFGPLILRGEYIHDSLPRETYTIGGPGYGVTQFRTKSDSNLFRLAIIYRFGETAPRPYADALGNVNWGGGYGGVFGGYGDVDVRSRFPGVARTKTTADGGLGGIYAGTNFMFFNNKVMLGIEGSTAFSDLTGHGREPVFGDRTSYREYVQADLRGRIGYAFGNVLPFVAAGISFARSEQRDVDPAFGGSEQGRVPTDNFTVGGGVDYRISQRISVRGEYLYESNIKNKVVNLNGFSIKQDRDANVFRLGVAYHFE